MTRRKHRRSKQPAAHPAVHTPLHEPTEWRLQHGHFGPPVREADPETGLTVIHRRAIDTLGQMLSNGTITADMHDAGQVFRSAFRAAALDPLRAMPMLRVPRATREPLTERTAAARQRVARALDALGGPASPAGSIVWHVVGCELSIREWAARQGWGGRPVGHAQAQGILVAALGMLAKHYGLEPRRRARRA
ncbi:DUF6456 domain-containing protein [Elioraea sp.]|uniref:DUF6456 domain-containing protein n=1 Tax=Elioraea sp. TaxID=2185103 RepID=UPI0021DC8896|nr:DUF6456 domain-containing protein [Elioraea sp.]GIX10347.1 MAG: hypothetical protein KatS3mg116_2057 [Elioraea sp.]